MEAAAAEAHVIPTSSISMAKKVGTPKKKVVASRKKSVPGSRARTELSHAVRVPKLAIGFAPTASGRLFAPVSRSAPVVPPSKIKSGIRSARRQIEESIEEVL